MSNVSQFLKSLPDAGSRGRWEDSECPVRQAPHRSNSPAIEVWLDIVRRYPEMKSWAAHNKTVPVEVLEILAGDQDAEVRMAIAMKRKCPHGLLGELSGDMEPAVRLRVAYNARTPRSVLERMLQDGWERVVEVAASRLHRGETQ